jgi:DNA-binding NtrC family response regulator
MTAPDARHPAVLVVDDEDGFRGLLEMELRRLGADVETAVDGLDSLRRISGRPFDVVVTDITMPGMDGLRLLRSIKDRWPDTQVILVTGFSGVETAVHAMNEGAFDFFLKPFDVDRLTACVQRAVESRGVCRHCRRRLS